MSYENLTARTTTAHSQAAEAAREFVPPQALEALRNAQALTDQLADLTAQLAAEKEAHAKTQAALDAATTTQ